MAPLSDGTDDMTEAPNERFDDDRLLAYALQFDDDVELEQALATDAALRERLLAVRADLGVVEDQVRAAVPAAEQSWADLSAARWDGLRPYVTTKPAPALRRRRFGLRVLAPVVGVAAVAALAVGLVLAHPGGGSSSTFSAGTASNFSQASPKTAAGSSGGAVPTVAADAAAYQTAVVARAGSVRDGVQAFAVLRTLKGTAGHTVQLSVEVGGALKQGALALLLLTPTDTLQGPAPTSVPAPSAVPSASASGVTEGRHVSDHVYLYKGTAATVEQLAAGTDPQAVTLP